jgi:hypothetical protein
MTVLDMTVPEIMEAYKVTEPTVYSWIRAGKWVATGATKPNKKGRQSRYYRLAVADPVGEDTPKWLLFEKRCAIAGREPNDVLALLLSRCNSISASAPGAYGDPDFLRLPSIWS